MLIAIIKTGDDILDLYGPFKSTRHAKRSLKKIGFRKENTLGECYVEGTQLTADVKRVKKASRVTEIDTEIYRDIKRVNRSSCDDHCWGGMGI